MANGGWGDEEVEKEFLAESAENAEKRQKWAMHGHQPENNRETLMSERARVIRRVITWAQEALDQLRERDAE